MCVCYLLILVYCIRCIAKSKTGGRKRKALNRMQTFINERVYKRLKKKAAPFFFSLSLSISCVPPQFLSDRSDSIQFLIHTANNCSTSSSSCYLKRIIYQNPP